jgi:hypothetical protein
VQDNTATVREGEKTLAEVARRLDVDLPDLVRANPQIRNDRALKAGQDIYLPPQINAAAEPPPASASPSPGVRHAGPGDPTLASLAQLKIPTSVVKRGTRFNFVSNPVGTGAARTHYNPANFATDETAQRLAKLLGGTVFSAPLREAGGGTPGSTFKMPDANYIRFPNGAIENAGQIAQWANQYGIDSPQFKTMLQQELAADAGMATDAAKQAGGAEYWYQRYVEHDGDS